MNYVSPDGDSPALAVGDSSMAFVANHGFRYVSEAELIDQCLDSCFLLGGRERSGKPELSGEHKGFFHGEHREKKIVLHNVGRYHFQKLRFQNFFVQSHGSLQATLRNPIRKRVYQRLLTGPTCSKNSHYLAFSRLTGDVIQQYLHAAVFAFHLTI